MWRTYGCLGLSVALLGCASSAEQMRAEPVWVFQKGEHVKSSPPGAGPGINLICHTEADRRGSLGKVWAWLSAADSNAEESNCLYVNVELKNLLQYAAVDVRSGGAHDPDKESARKVIHTLLSVSDYNCQNFLNRALALRSSSEFSAGLVGNISSGLSAATAAGDPGVSSALSVSSILLNAGSDQFNKTYYLNKTFDLFGKAIETSRKERRKEIVARLEPVVPAPSSTTVTNTGQAKPTVPSGPYIFMEALADVQEYSGLCSFRKGLEETAARVAGAAKDPQEPK
ncbi:MULTISPECIES: hypothetical protein [unclassified Pseudomonas]|uniref:hypothetical protein n=1 Tax=unclassified Pseudomonas TaxID=196821 RepID=UPI00244C3191|nr:MULTISPECIES: hypothetical protein [unclassified Pseudomonas]MDG9929384.1 hypothetical protein [Pseudomonas sp. GD04042]MDH0481640.1 hypothetical protein [Pseudomonas sp. GD04015]MDH0603012.1 hypothetical protein [Pseudomonas sp. GD03869]